MIIINSHNLNVSSCSGCGKPTVNLIRSVEENGRPMGRYHASLGGCHSGQDLQIQLIISVGGWDEHTDTSERAAFAMVLWADSTDFRFSLINADESVFRHIPSLGQLLSRDEALQHPWISHVFHIGDHILFNDQVVREFFGVTGAPMPCPRCAH